MDRNIVKSIAETTEFLLSPYKITLSVFIQEFTIHKSRLTQREIGSFCILIMKLVQGKILSTFLFKDYEIHILNLYLFNLKFCKI